MKHQEVSDLEDLLALMRRDDASIRDNWDELPVFSENAPKGGTLGIWSYDETRMIVGTYPGDVKIVNRDDL